MGFLEPGEPNRSWRNAMIHRLRQGGNPVPQTRGGGRPLGPRNSRSWHSVWEPSLKQLLCEPTTGERPDPLRNDVQR
jgi:hypothetical protein